MPPVIYHYKQKYPLITIGFRIPDRKWFTTEVYVDSGATYSVFSSKEADRLGLNYKNGKIQKIKVGNGAELPIYLNELEVQIGKHRIKASLGFSDKLGFRFNLLGRNDIFNHFKVCFDEKDKRKSLVIFHPFE